MQFSANLRAQRALKGLKQSELAAALGVSRQTIINWETKGMLPDVHKTAEIANFFNMTVRELLGIQNDKTEFISVTEKPIVFEKIQNNTPMVSNDSVYVDFERRTKLQIIYTELEKLKDDELEMMTFAIDLIKRKNNAP